jgi:nucleotidyltransferase/DNA polymerase involved in DNA repair
VTPSVGLLQEQLSLNGGLPPDRLARLRRLVDRVVRDLVSELTSRLRPAFTGGSVAQPTPRSGDPLDLTRTVARSLRTVRRRGGYALATSRDRWAPLPPRPR